MRSGSSASYIWMREGRNRRLSCILLLQSVLRYIEPTWLLTVGMEIESDDMISL